MSVFLIEEDEQKVLFCRCCVVVGNFFLNLEFGGLDNKQAIRTKSWKGWSEVQEDVVPTGTTSALPILIIFRLLE